MDNKFRVGDKVYRKIDPPQSLEVESIGRVWVHFKGDTEIDPFEPIENYEPIRLQYDMARGIVARVIGSNSGVSDAKWITDNFHLIKKEKV